MLVFEQRMIFFGCVLQHQMSDDFIFDELLTIVPDLIKLEQTQPTAETNEFEIDFSWCWF